MLRADATDNPAQATLEEELNREIDLLVYAISHDLRAPLRSITGFSEALSEDYGDLLDEVGRDFLRRIQQAGLQLDRYIDGILNFSRITREPLARVWIDLSFLAQKIADELAAQAPGRKVAFLIQPGLQVWGDPPLLSEVLKQLLSNAWKFSVANPAARIELGLGREDRLAYFVRDNGIGFDMDHAARRLFGLFQRMHPEDRFEGLGIGLAIVRRIINRHGGRIWAESAVNQGTTFFFTLPEAP